MGIRYSVNEKFFDTWTPEIAYLLGFLFADGHLIDAPYMRGKYVCFTSTDKDRLLLAKELLRSEHTISSRDRGGNCKTTYVLKIGSATLFKKLQAFGLTPHKSLTMDFPSVPTIHLPYFILGYFDGDGCVSMEAPQSERPKRLKTIFTCGSKKFVIKLDSTLRKYAGIQGGGVYNHGSTKSVSQARYTARDSIRLYLYMYKDTTAVSLALRRKYAIFRKYFDRLGIQETELQAVLKKKGPVAKEERIGLQNQHERVQLPPGPQKHGIVISRRGGGIGYTRRS